MTRRRRGAAYGLATALLALLAACASPGPPQRDGPEDREFGSAFGAARVAYERGQYTQARTLYQRALNRAHAIDAAGLAANAAYNLAMAEIGLQRYDAADAWLRQAEYDAGRSTGDASDIRMLRAKVAYLAARLPESTALIDALVSSAAPPQLLLQARLLRGQIHSETGDPAAARAELHAVAALVASATTAVSPALRADRAKLEGSVAGLEGDADAAARAFDREAQQLPLANRHRDMAYALGRAAEMHLRAGRPASAADRYFRAARSLAGQGDAAAARGFAASSEAAASAAGDPATRQRARALLDELKRPGDR